MPTVLSQLEIQINVFGIEFDRQAAAVVGADCGPDAFAELRANAGADGVALVLGDGEASGVGELVAGFATEKKAAGDGTLRAGGLVRTTEESGKASPFGDGETNFFAYDAGVVERNGKADASSQQNIVISEVAKVAAKDVGVEAKFAEERLGEAAFKIVCAGRAHRKADDDGIERVKFRRTGEKKILHRGSLKDAVEGKVEKRFG